jgi:hypothetical protein
MMARLVCATAAVNVVELGLPAVNGILVTVTFEER